MKQETIHKMNDILDIANELIGEDKDLLAKTEHKPTITYTGNNEDLIEDYKYSRDTLKNLISSGGFALAKMEQILQDDKSPRTFEVFSTLIKSIADLSNDLIKLQKQMKEIARPIGVSPKTTKTKGDEEEEGIPLTATELNTIINNKNK